MQFFYALLPMQNESLISSSSSSEDEEINLAAECSFTESDKEEAGNPVNGESKAKWRIDFGF